MLIKIFSGVAGASRLGAILWFLIEEIAFSIAKDPLEVRKINLYDPLFTGNEWNYVKECLDTGWVSSAGKYVSMFEEKIAKYTGAKFAISTVNGTSALQVSLRIAGVLPGDEVIVPTITFIAPVNAVHYNGADPIFMDSDSTNEILCDVCEKRDLISDSLYCRHCGAKIDK